MKCVVVFGEVANSWDRWRHERL